MNIAKHLLRHPREGGDLLAKYFYHFTERMDSRLRGSDE